MTEKEKIGLRNLAEHVPQMFKCCCNVKRCFFFEAIVSKCLSRDYGKEGENKRGGTEGEDSKDSDISDVKNGQMKVKQGKKMGAFVISCQYQKQ